MLRSNQIIKNKKMAKPESGKTLCYSMAGVVAGVLASVVLFAPASWIGAGLKAATGGRLLMLNARGTVWNGNAALLAAGGANSGVAVVLPSPVSWTLRPALSGLRFELQATCCTQLPILVKLRWNGLQIQGGHLSVPAGLLSGFGAPWNTLALSGTLDVTGNDFSVYFFKKTEYIKGEMVLVAKNISTKITTLPELGSYRISLVGGENPRLAVSTLQGDLQVSGDGYWNGSKLLFRGEAEAIPERADALTNLLTLLGRRQGNKTKIRLL